MLEQLWYTWCESGLTGRQQFQVRAASANLRNNSTAMSRAAVELCRFSAPRNTPPDWFSFGWNDPIPGIRAVFHKVAAGNDGFGRPGRFFVHIVIGPTTDLRPQTIAQWALSPWWQRDCQNDDPQELNQLDVDEVSRVPTPELDEALTERLMTEVLTPTDTRRRVAVVADPQVMAGSLAMLVERAPRDLVESLSFSTGEARTTQTKVRFLAILNENDLPGSTKLLSARTQIPSGLENLARDLVRRSQDVEVAAALHASQKRHQGKTVAVTDIRTLQRVYDALSMVNRGDLDIAAVEEVLDHDDATRILTSKSTVQQLIAERLLAGRPGLATRIAARVNAISQESFDSIAEKLTDLAIAKCHPAAWTKLTREASAVGPQFSDSIAQNLLLKIDSEPEVSATLGQAAVDWLFSAAVQLEHQGPALEVITRSAPHLAVQAILKAPMPAQLQRRVTQVLLRSEPIDAELLQNLDGRSLVLEIADADQTIGSQQSINLWNETCKRRNPTELANLANAVYLKGCSDELFFALVAGAGSAGTGNTLAVLLSMLHNRRRLDLTTNPSIQQALEGSLYATVDHWHDQAFSPQVLDRQAIRILQATPIGRIHPLLRSLICQELLISPNEGIAGCERIVDRHAGELQDCATRELFWIRLISLRQIDLFEAAVLLWDRSESTFEEVFADLICASTRELPDLTPIHRVARMFNALISASEYKPGFFTKPYLELSRLSEASNQALARLIRSLDHQTLAKVRSHLSQSGKATERWFSNLERSSNSNLR
jgi:GTPase-associated protein 1, N-terminal domain type 2